MQLDGNTNLALNLSLDMTNIVLKALSAQPYEQVAGIIASIQQQAAVQLQPPAAPAAPEPQDTAAE